MKFGQSILIKVSTLKNLFCDKYNKVKIMSCNFFFLFDTDTLLVKKKKKKKKKRSKKNLMNKYKNKKGKYYRK